MPTRLLPSQLSNSIIRIADKHVNAFGETALSEAPSAEVFDAISAVPQQYLMVNRNLEQLENIVSRITLPSGLILFVQQIDSQLYLQVGITGQENYPKPNSYTNQNYYAGKKIVYGRRWLIEPSAPTSEVIQTALLAAQNAREHELREHIKVRFGNGAEQATPFNTHLDLPLMALIKNHFRQVETYAVEDLIERVTVAGCKFDTRPAVKLNEDERLIRIQLKNCDAIKQLPFKELIGHSFNIVWSADKPQAFYHQLTDALISVSNRYVKEHFLFDGFNRFSELIDPMTLGMFSYQTRNVYSDSQRFACAFANMTHQVDANKTPNFNSGALGNRQRHLLKQLKVEAGFTPLE